MSIRYSYHIGFVALLLLLAACTKDELADDARLPEGQYPLQIAAVTLSVEGGEAQPWGAPQTRVSETEDGMGSVFDADDPFTVQIDGSTETATYTVQADGTVISNAPLYWSDHNTHTVNAWYSTTDGTLDLSDQEANGLAYLLHGTGTGDYQNPVTLTFTHRLAKVRVTPSNDIADDEVTSLQLYTYTTCTHTQGKINTEGAQVGWIEMRKCSYNGQTCWEANVVPGYDITQLRANSTEVRKLSASISPVAGSFYNITLNKKTYTASTAEELLAWAEAVQTDPTLNITLTDNITLTEDWTPIPNYAGTFDGGGNTITGLTINQSATSNVGLFTSIAEGGTVKNLTLDEVDITAGYYVGGVAGYSRGNIENCSVSGSVSGNSNSNGTSNCVGGVVGQQYGGTITECTSSAIVDGRNEVGGVAGKTDNRATLTACYATEDVTVERTPTNNTYAGGVVGFNGGGSTLIACYATGNVTVTGDGTGSIYLGGVTGDNFASTLTACYHAAGTVSGPDGATGGVTGRNFNDASGASVITACYWQNDQAKGIGYNQPNTGETTKVDGDWTEAMKAMNTALSGTDWKYVSGNGSIPLTLEKQ